MKPELTKYFFLICLSLFLFSCEENNLAPICIISSPEPNTIFKKGENVIVLVEAIDEDGSIAEVGILIDKNLIDNKTAVPFQFEINTESLSLGRHEISVYAVDDKGYNSSTFITFHIEIFNAQVQIDSVFNVNESSVIVIGSIADSGGGEIVQQGICWSTKENPTIEDSVKYLPENSFTMEAEISGLLQNTLYYFRFFAENESGISYSENKYFKTNFIIETVVDSRDGNQYKTVKIGNLTWMAENLKYLPNVVQPTTGSITDNKKYVYGQTACGCLGKAKANENYKIYGALYNFVAATEVCPEGWRLPTDNDWENMAQIISSNNFGYSNHEGTYQNVGNHLKSIDLWNQSTAGSDDYGFSALPGGFRDSESLTFLGLTNEAYFWSASTQTDSTAWVRTIKADDAALYKQAFINSNGFSVRCVKE